MKSNIEHVRHISKVMKNISTLVLWAVPVSLILIWANFDTARSFDFFHRLPDNLDHVGAVNYAGGLLVSGLVALTVIAAVYHLREFFALSSAGKMFSHASALALHKFSKYIILYAFLSIPAETLLSVILTMNNPVGERVVLISLQTYDITVIFLSLVLFTVSWVVKESAVIAEENAHFV